MKKTLLSILLMMTVLVCIASCSAPDSTPPIQETTPDSQQTPGGGAQETPQIICKLLQELSQEQYSKVKLDIKTVTDDIELNASYLLTNNTVLYSVEQLNLLPPDGDLTGVSSSCKTMHSGTAIIKNGKVDKIDGDVVNLPSYDELKGAFNFKESNFNNVKIENGKFIADVTSVSDFMGTSKNLSNMKVVVIYTDTALQTLEITYNTANSVVTTVYEFTR